MWRPLTLIPIALLFLVVFLGIRYNTKTIPPNKSATSEVSVQAKAQVAGTQSKPEKKGTILQNQGRHFTVPILMYHYIRNFPYPEDKMGVELSVSPDNFDKQLQYLASQGYTTISLDNLAAAFAGKATLPSKPIILTFDDSYIDSYSEAFPILKKYSMRGTMLTVADFVDTPGHVSWAQLTEMVNSGIIDIVSHSRTHPKLGKLSQPDLVNEVAGSKKIIEDRLGRRINWFGYPYGGTNAAVIAEVKKAEYVGALSTVPGINQYQGEIYNLRRLFVHNIGTVEFGKLLTTTQTQSN